MADVILFGMTIAEIIGQLLISILGSFLVFILALLFKPFRDLLTNATRKVWEWWKNPSVDVKVSIGAYYSPMPYEAVRKKVGLALSDLPSAGQVKTEPGIVRAVRRVGSLDWHLVVVPVSLGDPEELSSSLSIEIELKQVRVKMVDKLLVDIQAFLFQDVVRALNKQIKGIDPDVANEAVTVLLDKPPKALKSFKSFAIDGIHGTSGSIKLEVRSDKIRVSGELMSAGIEGIGRVVKENLYPQL